MMALNNDGSVESIGKGEGMHGPVVRGKMRRRAAIVAVGLIVVAIAAILAVLALQFRPPQDGKTWDSTPPAPVADNLDWKAVGGDPGQTKYSPIGQITPRNVGRLQVAWTYRTG